MISQAIALSLITFGGFFLVFKKLPEKVQTFIKEKSLLTDIVCLAGTYTLLGGTLTALFASALVGLFVSAALHVANHKEDFMYLDDFADLVKSGTDQVKETLSSLGKKYRGAL